MRVVNKEVVAETALDMEYETCYFKIDDRRWYSTTRTTRVQEIRHYGRPDEQELPPDHGSGYVWRLYSVAKFEQRDGGPYVEVEAIALSHNIPTALPLVVNPIVRRVSRNSMLVSLQQMKEAVRVTEDAARTAKLPTIAQSGSQGMFAFRGRDRKECRSGREAVIQDSWPRARGRLKPSPTLTGSLVRIISALWDKRTYSETLHQLEFAIPQGSSRTS